MFFEVNDRVTYHPSHRVEPARRGRLGTVVWVGPTPSYVGAVPRIYVVWDDMLDRVMEVHERRLARA